MKTTRQPALSRGMTLVEMLAALAVSAVALGSVLPDFTRLVQRQRLEGAAAQLETELQFARGEAVASGQALRFSFRADAARTCYVIHTGPANACRCDVAGTQCVGSARELRSVVYDAAEGLHVSSNVTSFQFDPVKGTVTPTASITLRNGQADSLKLIVSLMGRVRDCSPSGLPGHRTC